MEQWFGFDDDEEAGEPPVIEGGNRRVSGGEPPDDFAEEQAIARDAGGRFAKGRSAFPAGQFRAGQSGNPAGRPKGSGRFRAGARAAALLLDSSMEELMGIAIDAARDGDRVQLRNCLNKGLGPRRGQPVVLDDVAEFPQVTGPRDVPVALATIGGWIAEGRLTPEEALHVTQALGLPPVDAVAVEPAAEDEDDPLEELERRLERLAQQMAQDAEEAAAERAKAGAAEAAAMDASWAELMAGLDGAEIREPA